jgi:hypothetical protein
MLTKIGLVITGIGLAMFAMARVENVARHRGFSESQAWAQESGEQADDAVSQDDDAASQADAASQDDGDGQDTSGCKDGPAGGLYSGTVMDNNMGAGTIEGAFFQCRGKLTGNWQDTFVHPAFFSGTIKSNGAISAFLKFHLFSKCGYIFHGVFEHGNEIAGSYKLSGCKGMAADGGTFHMSK